MRITRDTLRSGSRRRGMLMLAELVFMTPILMMFFLGICEFYLMVATRLQLENASRSAVRTAASEGFTFKDLAATEADKTAHAVLGSGRLSHNAKVKIVWSQDLPPDATQGQADWVRAEVTVKARSVIPDVLGWVGFSLGDKSLVAGTAMKQE
jgi:Flp pilus assembly protein TadG